jgi:hypothetical protein
VGVGYSFGSFTGTDFTDSFGGELGFFFNKRTTSFPGSISYSATALNVPILARWSPFSDLRGFKFEIGPYFGILPTGSFTKGSSTLASSANIDSLDIGVMGGVSYFAPIKADLLFRATALYSFGFTDMASSIDSVAKTRGLDVYLGLVFLR